MEPTVTDSRNGLKEAIERTREAEAYQFEANVRRFSGDKVAAERYTKMREGRWSTRRGI